MTGTSNGSTKESSTKDSTTNAANSQMRSGSQERRSEVLGVWGNNEGCSRPEQRDERNNHSVNRASSRSVVLDLESDAAPPAQPAQAARRLQEPAQLAHPPQPDHAAGVSPALPVRLPFPHAPMPAGSGGCVLPFADPSMAPTLMEVPEEVSVEEHWISLTELDHTVRYRMTPSNGYPPITWTRHGMSAAVPPAFQASPAHIPHQPWSPPSV